MAEIGSLREVFLFLCKHKVLGMDPSLGEIALGLGLPGPSSVQRPMVRLLREGYISHERGKHRGWLVTSRGWAAYDREVLAGRA